MAWLPRLRGKSGNSLIHQLQLRHCPGYKTDSVLGPTELVQSASGDTDSKPANEETRKQTTIRAMQNQSNRKRKENWMGISRRPQREKCRAESCDKDTAWQRDILQP